MINFNDKILFECEYDDLRSENSLSFNFSKYDDMINDNNKIAINNNKKNIFFYIYRNKNNKKKREIKKPKKKILNIKIKNQPKKLLINTNNSNDKIDSSTIIWKVNKDNQDNNLYRKDAYYKHFKAIFGQYIRNKVNILKNKCFPYYSKNNISSPSYKYIGNPKEKDNFNFLSFTIKEILLYGIDIKKKNRQYNNQQIIKFIEGNEFKTNDKASYKELIKFLNDKLENVLISFYDDNKEFDKIKNDKKYIEFDKHYKHETGISLLEKYGFLEILKKWNSN